MIGIGVACPILMNGDTTVSLVAMPIGLWLLLTKERVMDFRL